MDLVDRARRRVGTTIGGKYRIDRVLGIGGMAAVFAATHRNGHRVALKLLNPELSARADMRARFRREGQAANAVNHPGVVLVIDDDTAEDGSAYLVMELLNGEVIEGIWEKRGQRLPASFVLALGRELCAVLAAAHAAGIVHRDLKPENLFLTSEGKLKVLDFGLAQLRDATRPKDTHTGMVFGTPAFMPPEQASGRTSQLDARTDLWAVGATMFTLLSGAMVHQGETAQHFVMLAATAPARPLAEVLPNVHPEIARLVDRALTFEKDQRWPSAQAMGEAIRATSKRVLGDANVPLTIPTDDADSIGEIPTRVGHILAPLEETLTDSDRTTVERPREVESSSPPTQPNRGTPIIAPAVAMGSDTPTTEREIDETEPRIRAPANESDESVTQPRRPAAPKPREDARAKDMTAHLPARAVAGEPQTAVIIAPVAVRALIAPPTPLNASSARGNHLGHEPACREGRARKTLGTTASLNGVTDAPHRSDCGARRK
jgi:serine/threonine protein kinase